MTTDDGKRSTKRYNPLDFVEQPATARQLRERAAGWEAEAQALRAAEVPTVRDLRVANALELTALGVSGGGCVAREPAVACSFASR